MRRHRVGAVTVTVLSAVYGGYDQPIPPLPQNMDVRWVMVTDGRVDVPAPWEHVIEPRPGMSARMASRYPKCHAVNHSHEGDPVLWLDGCADIRSPTFVADCLTALGDGDCAMWVHPHRNTLTAEAWAAAPMPKYQGQPLFDQINHYLKMGHPDGFGLWANTSMMWSADVAADVGAAWWWEQQEWGSDMDQLAWPVIVRRFGLDVRPFPGDLYDGERVRWRQHRDNL